MFNDRKRQSHRQLNRFPYRPLRHQFPLTWLEYEGAPEEHEDDADYCRVVALKAVRLG